MNDPQSCTQHVDLQSLTWTYYQGPQGFSSSYHVLGIAWSWTIGSKLSAFTYSLLTRSFQAFLPASKPCAVTHGVHHPSYLMKNATLFFRWTRCLNAPLPSKKGNGLVTPFTCKIFLGIGEQKSKVSAGHKRLGKCFPWLLKSPTGQGLW